MSFENFHLPPFLTEDLFKNHLVDLKDSSGINNSLKNNTIPSLGNNKKNILVLVNEANIPFLEDDDFNFLTGILGACKLSIADIALINCKKDSGLTMQILTQSFTFSKMLLFNVTPQSIQLPLQFPDFQVQQFDNRSFLAAPALKNIAAEKTIKMQLWESLKKIFSIS